MKDLTMDTVGHSLRPIKAIGLAKIHSADCRAGFVCVATDKYFRWS